MAKFLMTELIPSEAPVSARLGTSGAGNQYSDEEIGKAVYCNWAINGYVRINNKFLKKLKSHRTKLKVLMEVERLALLQEEINKKQTNKNKKHYYPENEVFDTLSKVEKMPEFTSIERFYLNLDKLKQDSLYVDIKDNFIPSSPDFITKDVAEFYLDFAKMRLLAVKMNFS